MEHAQTVVKIKNMNWDGRNKYFAVVLEIFDLEIQPNGREVDNNVMKQMRIVNMLIERGFRVDWINMYEMKASRKTDNVTKPEDLSDFILKLEENETLTH